jgi:hypothetical protein
MQPHEGEAAAWWPFLALQESPLGHAMRSSPLLYPLAEIVHILGFVVLVGAILALDLRLLGLARGIALAPLAGFLLPLSRLGFALAVAMGFLLFSADASHVVRNPAFQTKMALLALALANIAVAHAGPWRRLEHWQGEAPAAARLTAFCSLVLWLSVVCAGRLIAYF